MPDGVEAESDAAQVPLDTRAPTRESPRVEADFQVSYPTVDQLVVAYAADLSRGGLFIATERFLPVNAVVRVTIELPDGGGTVPVICRVASVRDATEAGWTGKPVGMGLEFLDLASEYVQLLGDYIAERMDADATHAPKAQPLKRISVLIVDDDVSYQKQAAAPFRTRGDYVRVAGDGFEALAMCLKDPPDIILADVQMPRMDGWQLLRLIRGRPSLASIPVIFMTTLSGDEERLRGYQLGVDDYLAKPYRPAELKARVDRLATRQQQQTHALIARKTLRGDLQQVALPSVLAFLEREQKTGELLVVGAQTARLYLKHGRPLRVEIEEAPPMTQEELAFELLGWTQGQFELAVRDDVAIPNELGTTITALLLEHARRKDEAAR